jgi:hypothetical protein
MYATLLYAVFRYFSDIERTGVADYYGTGLTSTLLVISVEG